jgi:hypothetical protein
MATTPEGDPLYGRFQPPEDIEPNTPEQVRIIQRLSVGASAPSLEEYLISKKFLGFVAQRSFDSRHDTEDFTCAEAVRFGVDQATAMQYYPRQHQGILDYADFGVVEEWLTEMDGTETRVHGMSIRDYLFAHEADTPEAASGASTLGGDEAEVLMFIRDDENRKALSVFTAIEFYLQEFGFPKDETGLRVLGRMVLDDMTDHTGTLRYYQDTHTWPPSYDENSEVSVVTEIGWLRETIDRIKTLIPEQAESDS